AAHSRFLVGGYLYNAKRKRECAAGGVRRVERHQIKVVSANTGKPRFLPPRPFPRKIKESLVFLDCSAKIETRLHTRIRRIRHRAERVDGLKISVAYISERGAMNIIRPGTRNNVHDSARGAPIFGGIAVGDDLKLLH